MKNHSLLDNVKYVFRKMVEYDHKTILYLILIILSSIALPVLTTLIPTIAVGLISNRASIGTFLIDMAFITGIYMVGSFVKSYYGNIQDYNNIFIRLTNFLLPYASKILKTDYINVESSDNQILSQKGINSLSSNWVGPELMMKYMAPFLINLVGLITYACLISSVSFWIVIILIFMSIINFLLSKHARNYEEKHKDEYTAFDKKINYLYNNSISLNNGKDARIYKLETWFHHLFCELIEKRVIWQYKLNLRYLFPNLSDSIFLFLRDAVAYMLLINMFLENKISIVSFTFFLGIISGFSNWLNGMVEAINCLKRSNLGVNDYRAYIDIPEKQNHSKGFPTEVIKTPISIEFKNVSFRYTGSDHDTINNLNLKIHAGEKIALVGINGAGKTTIVKLLSGFYTPDKGEILLNGIKINNFNIYDYYKLIGVVFQDVTALALKIAQNVACLPDEKINYNRLWKCLEQSGLKEKVESLNNKENTYLTQAFDKDGVLLSGGETQKMMLARALYKNAPIMILDEPTSALDPLTEADLYEKYCSLTKDKTSIFISHRLSSTRFCDRILYLENGTILENGNHDELMKLGGSYAHMYEIQSQYYKENQEVVLNA